MGVISTILGFSGFGIGVSAGVCIGYYLFIYFQPSDVKVNIIYYFLFYSIQFFVFLIFSLVCFILLLHLCSYSLS
jgi:hypothetical protein